MKECMRRVYVIPIPGFDIHTHTHTHTHWNQAVHFNSFHVNEHEGKGRIVLFWMLQNSNPDRLLVCQRLSLCEFFHSSLFCISVRVRIGSYSAKHSVNIVFLILWASWWGLQCLLPSGYTTIINTFSNAHRALVDQIRILSRAAPEKCLLINKGHPVEWMGVSLVAFFKAFSYVMGKKLVRFWQRL